MIVYEIPRESFVEVRRPKGINSWARAPNPRQIRVNSRMRAVKFWTRVSKGLKITWRMKEMKQRATKMLIKKTEFTLREIATRIISTSQKTKYHPK